MRRRWSRPKRTLLAAFFVTLGALQVWAWNREGGPVLLVGGIITIIVGVLLPFDTLRVRKPRPINGQLENGSGDPTGDRTAISKVRLAAPGSATIGNRERPLLRSFLIGVGLFLIGWWCAFVGLMTNMDPKSLTTCLALPGLMVAMIGAVMCIVSVITGMAQLVRTRFQIKTGHCPCGYDLHGNLSGKCPECGRGIECRCDSLSELDGQQADDYANDHLEKVEIGDWKIFYVCPDTGVRWMKEWPHSECHCEGRPLLRRISGSADEVEPPDR